MSAGIFWHRALALSVTVLFSTWCAAETYYVSTQGRDSASGTSSSSAFKSLEKAFGALNKGDTLYLRKGDVWKPSKSLAITAPNVTIGAYGSGARPVIDGQKKVPTLGSYYGLIHVTGDNAKIRDIFLKNSGGSGIKFSKVDGVLAENVKVDWTYRFSLQAERSSDIVFKDCESVRSAAQFVDPNRPNGGWPHGLSILASTDAIVEGCVIHEGWGEGIGTYRGSQRVVLRDNFVYGMRAVGIYVDNGSEIEILRNIVLGTTDKTFHRSGSGYTGPGIYISNETENVGLIPPQDIKIYNNLVAYTQAGIAFGGQPADFKNVKVAHNTFVDNKVQFNTYTQDFSGSGNVFANNIFLSISGASSDVGKSLTRSSVAWHNNYWSTAPHAAMRSPGDVYGGAKIAKMTGWKSIKPTPEVSAIDFIPLANSTTNGAGKKLAGLDTSEDFNGAPRRNAADLGALNYLTYKVAKPSSPGAVAIK